MKTDPFVTQRLSRRLKLTPKFDSKRHCFVRYGLCVSWERDPLTLPAKAFRTLGAAPVACWQRAMDGFYAYDVDGFEMWRCIAKAPAGSAEQVPA